jgi:NAD(P)H-dependent FMN reductase
MKFTIISGSGRENSQSTKVARFCEGILKKQDPSHELFMLDLAGNPLPLWDEGMWNNGEKWQKLWTPISEKIKETEALVVVAPEWSGMVPGGLKNIFHLCSKHELAHKPAMIIGVSNSTGGAYPVAELRMTSYKNTRICYIPDHVIVRNVEKILNGEASESGEDTYVRGRLEYSLRVLTEYGKAFRQIRESGAIDLKLYANGM